MYDPTHEDAQRGRLFTFLLLTIAGIIYVIIAAHWPGTAVSIAAYFLLVVVFLPVNIMLPGHFWGGVGTFILCGLTIWAITSQHLSGASWQEPLQYWYLSGVTLCIVEMALFIINASLRRTVEAKRHEIELGYFVRGSLSLACVTLPAIVHGILVL